MRVFVVTTFTKHNNEELPCYYVFSAGSLKEPETYSVVKIYDVVGSDQNIAEKLVWEMFIKELNIPKTNLRYAIIGSKESKVLLFKEATVNYWR